MKKNLFLVLGALMLLITMLMISCGDIINTNNNEHFDDEGYLITDSTVSQFSIESPNKIKFYVEVSGSMNGFFRANKPTKFKADVWQILSYYAPAADGVTILTNDGTQGAKLQIGKFQTQMNTGAFVSSGSYFRYEIRSCWSCCTKCVTYTI